MRKSSEKFWSNVGKIGGTDLKSDIILLKKKQVEKLFKIK